MDKIKRDGFLFYRSYYEAVNKLPNKQDRLTVYEAIFEYALNGEEVELSGVADAVFTAIKPNLTASRNKAENGSKGGKANRKQVKIKSEASESISEAIKDKEQGIKDKRQEIKDIDTESSSAAAPTLAQAKKAEPKKVKYAEYVTMTEAERQKLVEEYGEEKTARMITTLDNYKGSTGKKYKDDYRAILSWVVKKIEGEQAREAPSQTNAVTPPVTFKASTGFRKATID